MRQPYPAELVSDFHRAFDVPIRLRPTNILPNEDVALRRSLIAEEAREVDEALASYVLEDIAKELADLVYVVYGTALTYGIDLDVVLAEVHRSNMSKLGDDGRPVLRADGKVLKGPHYREADIAGLLDEWIRDR